jgi:predicted dithiol-disulfide oxidoreductase (DUF899 family)
MNAGRHSITFPDENENYRAARNELLEAEIKLRQNLEQVAALRRKLPFGGQISEDYEFKEGATDLTDTQTVKTTRLSELFAPDKDSLIIYSFMYGPDMQSPCTSCTSILDGINGMAFHAMDRINLAVVAKSPIERIRAFARERGWRNLRLLSSAGCSYNRDYHAEMQSKEGRGPDQLPALNVFTRKDGKIYHFYNTELLYVSPESGQDGRHVDLIWPLWNLFDLTPEGRGEKWYPRLSYQVSQPRAGIQKSAG